MARFNAWRHTIRGKLTFWYITTFTILFTVFLMVASFIFWNILNEQIEHHLHTVLEQVETVWNQSGIENEKVIQSLVASQGMVVMVMAPDGDILLQSTSEDITLPTQHQLQQHLVMLKDEDIDLPHYFSIGSVRFVLTPTSISPTVGVIGIGFQTAFLQNAFQQSVIALGVLLFGSIVLLCIVGYVLARRAMQPIRTITTTAKAITNSSDLHDRIPNTESQGELGELIQILNSMLSRLETAFNSQKQFLSDAAHTLKTPLTVLRTQIERLDTNDSKKRKLFETLDQLSSTVQDFLYISRLQVYPAVGKQQIDLTSLVYEIVEITKTLAEEKDINIEVSIQEEVYITGDKSLFIRALLNIAENAITYTPPKGTVRITLYISGKQVIVSFEDTGIGIPKREITKVTNRFFRASNSLGQGTGLGLAIAKAVIESMSGTLEIDSKLHEGTTVSIIFSQFT